MYIYIYIYIHIYIYIYILVHSPELPGPAKLASMTRLYSAVSFCSFILGGKESISLSLYIYIYKSINNK